MLIQLINKYNKKLSFVISSYNNFLLNYHAFCLKEHNMEKQREEKLKKFGNNLKKLRTDLNLSQDDVVLNSDKLVKATVSDIENGKRNFAYSTLLDLAKGLGKEPKDLLDFE